MQNKVFQSAFIFLPNTNTDTVNITAVYPSTISVGTSTPPSPFRAYCAASEAFRNGSIFISVMNPPLSPSTGNHMPLNTDWHIITI